MAKYPTQGMHMSKLLAIMAAILPISVLFQIHQVVDPFQVRRAKNTSQKKCDFLLLFSAKYNRGQNAIKTRKNRGDTGHAA
jgi:hypothetical protein